MLAASSFLTSLRIRPQLCTQGSAAEAPPTASSHKCRYPKEGSRRPLRGPPTTGPLCPALWGCEQRPFLRGSAFSFCSPSPPLPGTPQPVVSNSPVPRSLRVTHMLSSLSAVTSLWRTPCPSWWTVLFVGNRCSCPQAAAPTSESLALSSQPPPAFPSTHVLAG